MANKRLRLSQKSPILLSSDLALSSQTNKSTDLSRISEELEQLRKYEDVEQFAAHNSNLDLWFGKLSDEEILQFLIDNPDVDA